MKLPRENPRIPEGINNTATHPLRELLFLGIGLCVLLLLTCAIIWTVFNRYAQWIPISWERRMAPEITTPDQYQASRQQLQARLNRLLMAIDFDEGTQVPIHIIESNESNAFATLGPQIVVTTHLLEDVQSDIGLDMVLAHEAAHIVHRDPIRTLAGTLGVQLLISLMSGDSQVSALTGAGSHLLLMSYSRDQETAADDLALQTLYKVHGTLTGADEFFKQILVYDDFNNIPAFLSTHPHPRERIEHIRDVIRSESLGDGE